MVTIVCCSATLAPVHPAQNLYKLVVFVGLSKMFSDVGSRNFRVRMFVPSYWIVGFTGVRILVMMALALLVKLAVFIGVNVER